MSDVEVVQRVLQNWAPIGYSYKDWLYDGICTFDEYDRYAFEILDLLRQECSEQTLSAHLDTISLDKMGARGGKKEAESKQNNRAFTAMLRAVWRTQHDNPDSNVRKELNDFVETKPFDAHRTMSDLEIVERALEELDAKKVVYLWLLGDDRLNVYDSVAVEVLEELYAGADRNAIARLLLTKFDLGHSKESASRFIFFAEALLSRWAELRARPELRKRRNLPKLKIQN